MTQIRPGLVFTRKVEAHICTYRVMHEDSLRGFWKVACIDLDGRAVIGLPVPVSGREIQDAMSKGETT